MKQSISLLIFIMLSINIFAQDDAPEIDKSKFKDAEYLALNEAWSDALKVYKELLIQDPENAFINYKAGLCYLNMPFENGRSIPYFEKAIKNTDPNVFEGKYKERRAPVHAFYYLGYAYHINRYFSKALKTYNIYKERLPKEDIPNRQMVERQLISCETAKELVRYPIDVEIDNVGRMVNTKKPEFNPCVTTDGNTLVYTTIRERLSVDSVGVENIDQPYYLIFITYKDDDGRWSEPKDITNELGTRGLCKSLSISGDGNRLLLHRDDWEDGGLTDYQEGTIYYSELDGESWTLMRKLNNNINSTAWESHACISPDGNKIYFTSSRKGGFGGLDIYVSEMFAGDWGPAVNLGPSINTPFDEETPYVLEDGKTIFFSSEGHRNMGGHDIFASRLLENGEWSEPLNLGYPINSPDDNIFYVPVGDGATAYYSQARYEGYITFGAQDIYKMKINIPGLYETAADVEGTVILEDMASFNESIKVFAIDQATGDTIAEAIPDPMTGKYKLEVSSGMIKVVFVGDGYRKVQQNLSFTKVFAKPKVELNARLIPTSVVENKYYVIKNVYFEYDSDSLTKEALDELENLYKVMTEHNELKLEVIGHTDSKGTAEYNEELSMKRATAVVNHLVDNGINRDRFVAKGLGKSFNIAINENVDGTDNEKGRALNRRVELKVLNSSTDLIVTLSEEIPEDLRIRNYSKFAVILKRSLNLLEDSVFKKVLGDSLQLEFIETKKAFLYYAGMFEDRSHAIPLLKSAHEAGFTEADIIDYYELNSKNKFVIKSIEETPDLFVIQLTSSPKKLKNKDFNGLEGVEEILSDKKYYRYMYKEFKKLEDAKEELQKVIGLGFKNAFIMNKQNITE